MSAFFTVKSIPAYLNETAGLLLNVRAIFVIPASGVPVGEALPGSPGVSPGLLGSRAVTVVGLPVGLFKPEDGTPDTLQPANTSDATSARLRRANLNNFVKRRVFIAFSFQSNLQATLSVDERSELLSVVSRRR
jgi:hypothetical protein